jgi:hypothetical protein
MAACDPAGRGGVFVGRSCLLSKRAASTDVAPPVASISVADLQHHSGSLLPTNEYLSTGNEQSLIPQKFLGGDDVITHLFSLFCLQRGGAHWALRGSEQWSAHSAACYAEGVIARSTQSDLWVPGTPVSAAAGQFSDPLSGGHAEPIDRFYVFLYTDGNGANHL